MKTTIKKILGILLVAGFVFSCKENEGLEFEGEATIYFYNEEYEQEDSIAHSFFMLPSAQDRDTVEIRIEAGGYPVDYDRTFSLVQSNVGESGAAEAGKHFIAFDDPAMQQELVMPANAVSKVFHLILLRDESLEAGTVRLALNFTANEHFQPGVEEWRNFVVTTTARPEKPDSWDDVWVYDFGEWGPVKMEFIIRSTGFSDFDAEGISADTGYRTYLLFKATQALLEYNETHDPDLTEEDGTLVEFEY